MKNKLGSTLLLVAPLLLVACGGDGGDGGDGLSTTAPGGGSGTSGPDSYWTMDDHTYANGHASSQQSSPLTTGGQVLTVAIAATLNDTGNGAYSGSSITFEFLGDAAGTYDVVSDLSALVASDASAHLIYIQGDVGIGVTTGASMYVPQSGQVTVTKDAGGVFHFSTAAALPADKDPVAEVGGGVAGSPATMSMALHDVY